MFVSGFMGHTVFGMVVGAGDSEGPESKKLVLRLGIKNTNPDGGKKRSGVFYSKDRHSTKLIS